MTPFWILAALLTLFALLFILEPLMRARRHRQQQERLDAERRQQNVAIFKDRIAELEADRDTGQIDESQFAILKSELEASLLVDVEGTESSVAPRNVKRRTQWLALSLAVAIPALAFGLYQHWGNYEGVKQLAMFEAMQAEGTPDVDSLLAQLETSLRDQPENPDGWFMLARTRMSLGQYSQAAEAFKTLAQLLQNEPQEAASIYGLYAQALYFANDGHFDAASKAAIQEALKRNPDEINSLGLLGIESFENSRYADAARYWQRILVVNPDNPNADSIRNGIQRAQELLAQSGQAPEQSVTQNVADQASQAAPSLQVQVTLSPELAANASPEDTLFVYARAVNGPRMPLAIVRKQVKDLPLTVTLDDSTAMGPMAKLSSATQVDVIARISKQGTPAPNAGDLEGMVTPVEVKEGEQVVNVAIGRLVE